MDAAEHAVLAELYHQSTRDRGCLTPSDLFITTGFGRGEIAEALVRLRDRGSVRAHAGRWSITPSGLEQLAIAATTS